MLRFVPQIFFLGMLLGVVFPGFAQDKTRPEYRQAVEVAKLTAQRNLAETVLGVLIKSGTEVKDFVLQKDVVITKVTGQMRGVVYSRPFYDKVNQIIRVAARINRKDVIDALNNSNISGAENLPEDKKFFDATGESVYEESKIEQSSVNNTKEITPKIQEIVSPHKGTFSLPFRQLAELLFKETNVEFPSYDSATLIATLKNRTKIYLGLHGDEGVQLEMRLSQANIQLILQAFILDYFECDQALEKAKALFKNGVLLGCLLKGGKAVALPQNNLSWYEQELNLYYELAVALTEALKKQPSEEVLAFVKEECELDFVYYRGNRNLKLTLTLDAAGVQKSLNCFRKDERTIILESMKNGIQLTDILSGEALLINSAWVTLGTPVLCPKASGRDFTRKGFFVAKRNAQNQATALALQYLETNFGLTLKTLPMTSPLFQGVDGSKVVVKLGYSKNLLYGYLKQKYSEEELQQFLENIGKGLIAWGTAAF